MKIVNVSVLTMTVQIALNVPECETQYLFL